MKLTWVDEITYLIKARCPLLALVSYEEGRIQEALLQISQQLQLPLLTWSRTAGVVNAQQEAVDVATKDPLALLKWIADYKQAGIFLLKDFHPFTKDASVVRWLRDLNHSLKTSHKTIILLSPQPIEAVELSKDLIPIDVPLPTSKDIEMIVDKITQSIHLDLGADERQQLTSAALGLTQSEIENVIANSLVRTGMIDVRSVMNEKRNIVKKSGIMDFIELNQSLDDVGGMERLKHWLVHRQQGFSTAARQAHLPAPKGILLVGIPGCGKSLTARATASTWNLPLLRLDVGRVFAGVVGASEHNMRLAIQTAEAVSPCVLWIDEVEKAFAGMRGGGAGDSGTSLRVFGTFLTWMQENQKPVFVVATANNIAVLPPEFLRKGRFDELFFVDLPSETERLSILQICLKRYEWELSDCDTSEFLQASHGFSGAEIEQALIHARYEAFFHQRPLCGADLMQALRSTVPLSTTMQQDIETLRNWAKTRAVLASIPPHADQQQSSGFAQRAITPPVKEEACPTSPN